MKQDTTKDWRQVGVDAAHQIKTTPKKLAYIEARGSLCHELLYLLGGHIQFIETPMRQWLLKIFEFFLPVSPICQWYPQKNSSLEQIGYYHQSETKVYKLTKDKQTVAIFFIEYSPEPPAGGRFVRSFFNFPYLKEFLKPPYETSDYNEKLNQDLRDGLVEKFTPIPMTEDARNYAANLGQEMHRGLWDELNK